jgi:hypothetical protein
VASRGLPTAGGAMAVVTGATQLDKSALTWRRETI